MAFWKYHSNLLGPTGNWPLNGSLLDISGNGYDLTVEAGTQRDDDLVPGMMGWWLDGSTRLLAPANAALLPTGDCTVAFFIRPTRYPTAATGSEIFTVGVPNTEGSEANNFLIRVLVTQTAMRLQVSWEQAGMDEVDVALTAGLMNYAPSHVLVRRTGLLVEAFVNLELAASATATALPTGGTNGRLRIGGGTTNASFEGVVASVIFFADRALTDEELPDLLSTEIESGASLSISHVGGDVVELSIPELADGEFYVFMNPEGDAASGQCFPAVRGQGKRITILSGAVKLVAPPRSIAEVCKLRFQRLSGTGDDVTVTEAFITILPAQIYSSVFSLRSRYHEEMNTGPRSLRQLPYPQEND